MAMSPMGKSFRSNMRNFPSLNNCTTIDFFSEWPEDALISVARYQVNLNNLELYDSKDGVINLFSFLHKSVENLSKDFLTEFGRYN
mmetsp:Transcript_22471/g.50139  ORF Transcript_22471/g.50139 Transcript_22471/m.50139 type:complete len:86 (-) Transcript_22471:542-799(-)